MTSPLPGVAARRSRLRRRPPRRHRLRRRRLRRPQLLRRGRHALRRTGRGHILFAVGTGAAAVLVGVAVAAALRPHDPATLVGLDRAEVGTSAPASPSPTLAVPSGVPVRTARPGSVFARPRKAKPRPNGLAAVPLPFAVPPVVAAVAAPAKSRTTPTPRPTTSAPPTTTVRGTPVPKDPPALVWTQADQDAADAACVKSQGAGAHATGTPELGATYQVQAWPCASS